VPDLSPQAVGVFDVVLFLGVFYHMRHPFLALERVAAATGELLILDTHVDLLWRRHPVMAFYPGEELAGDPTNWWGPNPAAVQSMLRSVGFAKVAVFKPSASPGARLVRAGKTRLRGRSIPPHVRAGKDDVPRLEVTPSPGIQRRAFREGRTESFTQASRATGGTRIPQSLTCP
jgi:tRNA (mo5U34)-methyltransferase